MNRRFAPASRFTVASILFLVFQATQSMAAPISLDKLVAGSTLECGNLKFTKFEYDRGASPDAALAADVAVSCLDAGLPGLRFDGSWAGNQNNGGIFTSRFAYQVNVLNSTGISFAQLIANPTATGDDFLSISEILFTLADGCPT